MFVVDTWHWLWISLAALAIACTAMVLAWRGRRVNARPVCRKCRYVLEGLNNPATCPECGADLARRGAIRIGERRRRRSTLAIGVALLAIALTLCTLTGVKIAGEVEWIELKPVWMLKRDANGLQTLKESVAVQEIIRRSRVDRIDETSVQWWIDRALARQADLSRIWDPAWGDLVQYAWSRGWVSDERMDAYLRGAVAEGWTIDHRPKVREGSRIAVRVRLPTRYRVGSDQSFARFNISMRYVRMKIGDREEPASNLTISDLTDTPLPGEWRLMTPRTSNVFTIPARISATLLQGEHQIEVTLQVGVRPSQSGDGLGGFYHGATGWPADHRVEFEKALTSEVEIVPATQLLIEIVSDEEALAALRDGIANPTLQIFGPIDWQFCSLEIDSPRPTIPTLWHGWLVVGDQRWSLGAGTYRGMRQSGFQFRAKLQGFPETATHADVVLTADPQLAEESLDVGDRILDGEIVIKNLPIEGLGRE